jgi:exodeoxyribonuclease VII small subunit
MEENKVKKSSSSKTKKKNKTFEDSMSELEEIVQKLEKGDLPLEESIEYFQRGIELSRECTKKLDEIEKRITVLIENEDGELVEEPFSVEN